MSSLFAKILVWFWATLIITIIGSGLITAFSISSSDRQPPLSRMVGFDLEEARFAYESGGREGLASFMHRFHTVYESEAVLTDASGRDLLTSADRSDLLEHGRKRITYAPLRSGRSVISRASADGKYWFFLLIPRARIGSWFLLPQHLYIIAAEILLCYLLAYHLTSPVRALQKAVERFGHGDLSARAGSTRRDELGDLARTFDRMADRTQMLLGAERRLLLDISHELRSPLARLGVAVELARSGDNREAALDRIAKESERLNALVTQLLQVTRAEGDPNALRASAVALDELLAVIVDDCAIEAQARGCSLEIRQRDPAVVHGDPELLRRAIENVVRNAIRHAPQGTAVEVSLLQLPERAKVLVRDYGPGVPEEALPRIFDAFYRVESDRNRSTGGVGLGLAIARRAIELHHGTLAARNAQPGLAVEIGLPYQT